jgi:class 3 adenylate cyclase
MVDAHEMICEQLKKEGLPRVDYRISLDYRAGVLMRTSDSTSPDMIGPTLNMCSKISRLASKNGIVVGGDMYQRVKGYKESSLIR